MVWETFKAIKIFPHEKWKGSETERPDSYYDLFLINYPTELPLGRSIIWGNIFKTN